MMPKKDKAGAPASIVRAIARFAIFLALTSAVLFVAAGRWDWGIAWVYVAIQLLFTVGSRILMALKDPELLTERAHYQEKGNAKSWDKKLMPVVALYGPLVMWVVAGLDERWGWSPEIGTLPRAVATLALIAGYALATWAFMANRFFAAVVRIQEDRGHTVISHGPYSVVRHPGYAGGALGYLATPIVLGSWWALVPAVLTIAGMVARTALEDRTLQEELAGYKDYARRTRYRLLPGIW